MKRFISLTLSIIMVFSLAIHTFATEIDNENVHTTPEIVITGDDVILVSSEYIPDEVIEEELPDALRMSINSTGNQGNFSPYGINPPSSSNVWDLSEDIYYFWCDFNVGYMYSNYVFKNHGGGVQIACTDTSGSSGFYKLSLFVKDGSGFTLHTTYDMRHSTTAYFLVRNLAISDVVYFRLYSPTGTLVLLDQDRTYLRGYSS